MNNLFDNEILFLSFPKGRAFFVAENSYAACAHISQETNVKYISREEILHTCRQKFISDFALYYGSRVKSQLFALYYIKERYHHMVDFNNKILRLYM